MAFRSAALCLFIAGASLANAQSETEPDETLVVTGTRVPRLRAPVSAIVIDAEAIETRNDASVIDLLRDVPGLHVSAPSGRGSVGSVFLRGGEANFTSVLIDGIQINDPTNTRGGSFDFSTLNIDDIARIEIVPGPLSSIYGTDALSGVINIITRSGGEQFDATVDAEFGGSHYTRAGIGVGGPVGTNGKFTVRLGGIDDGATGDAQWLSSRSITGKFETEVGRSGRLSVYARHGTTDTRAFPDASGGTLLSVLRLQDDRDIQDNTLGFAFEAELNAVSSLHVQSTLFEHREKFTSPGVAPGIGSGIPPNESDGIFFRTTTNLFVSSAWTDHVETAFGLNYQRDTGESAGLIELGPGFRLPTRYQRSRDIVGLFAEVAYASDSGFGLIAGLRTDDTDLAGRQTNGKFSAHYELPGDHFRLRAGWGRAFKLPSLFALADPLVGNPNLRPETAENRELGFDSTWLDGRAGAQLTYFDQRFEDLIDFDFDQFRTVNRSQVETDGIELSGHYEFAVNWRVAAHVTDTDIDVVGSDATLTQRPERRGGVDFGWQISESLQTRVAWLYVGERFDSSIPTGEQALSSYDRVDLTFSWRSAGTILWRFAVDNLFDQQFEDAIGFPDLGRRVRVSVRTEFR